MLPESKICRFCAHQKCEHRQGKKCSRLVRYCELGKKKLNASRTEDFNRCKFFDPVEKEIDMRESLLQRVIRDCEAEMGYLERLRDYMNHRRRQGAEYVRKFACHNPLVCADGEEANSVSADGFEEGETI